MVIPFRLKPKTICQIVSKSAVVVPLLWPIASVTVAGLFVFTVARLRRKSPPRKINSRDALVLSARTRPLTNAPAEAGNMAKKKDYTQKARLPLFLRGHRQGR